MERLTKSNFLTFLSCPREFWLKAKKPELFLSEDTLQYTHLREQGYKFEAEAKKLNIFQIDGAARMVEFGRVFETFTLYAKSDAVVTDTSTGGIHIYEIKSSASVKDEHIYDVAFQWIAAEGAGFQVTGASVITVNTSYVRNGDIDPAQICSVTDVTDRVLQNKEAIRTAIATAFECLDVEPRREILGYCGSKLDCTFIRHHFPDLPEYTVFALGNLNQTKRDELIAQGIIDIRDIPEDFKLSDRQRIQVDTARTGEARINVEDIKNRLEGLVYPLHFLDYETFGYAVPHHAGIRPYQQMAFQYSLHTLSEPGGECVHTYFLSDGSGTPPLEMARSLRDSIGDNIGTVIVWSQGFEKTVNKQIGEMFPEFADFFAEVNDRTFDLRKIFSDLLYVHPSFHGSTSIKKVMPVVAPHLSYDSLEIGDGMTASIKWFHMATGRNGEEESRAIYEALCAYCHLDTWAMVEIFKFLKAL